MNPALLLLADGRFPAGGHAHSAGAESAVHYGDVTDLASLERYLAGRLATAGVVDAVFAAQACAAVGASATPSAKLAELDVEYEIRVASPRARLVSRQLGRQLARAAHVVWPHPALERAYHQPVSLGIACAAAGGVPGDASALALHHLSSAICSAAVRMLGLDPSSVAALQARGVAGVEYPLDSTELPTSTSTLAEILAEDHGRWDARLFVA